MASDNFPRETRNAAIDEARLWTDIMALAEITQAGQPFTRRSFSPLYVEGRKWLRDRFVDAGMSVTVDAAGNMVGRLEGEDSSLPAIIVGSHTDTVPGGGRFDGILGVLSGIEIVRALGGRKLRHPLEVIDFLAEEPSEFGLSCVGSRGLVGKISPEMLKLVAPGDNETLAEAIARLGGRPGELKGRLRKDVAAFLEIHIEQGRILEEAGVLVGLVTAIVGIVRIEIEFTGAPDHSGTTPFSQRRDALLAAAQVIGAVRDIGADMDGEGQGYIVSTVGSVHVSPNAANVVPGTVRMVVEARAELAGQLDQFISRLDRHSAAAAAASNVDRSAFKLLSRSEPTTCDPALRSHLIGAAAGLGLVTKELASGAGHDAAFMGQICPTGMIFVPSRDGRSHCPEEWTGLTECAAGAAVMFEAVLRIDADSAFDAPRE